MLCFTGDVTTMGCGLIETLYYGLWFGAWDYSQPPSFKPQKPPNLVDITHIVRTKTSHKIDNIGGRGI